MKDKKFNNIAWPLVLIGLGVIGLLSNFDILPRFSINAFLSLWPLILVAVGINILLAPSYPRLRPWIGMGMLVLAISLVYLVPSLGSSPTAELKEAHFSEPIGNSASARVVLDLSIGETVVQTLSSGGSLIEADVTYYDRAEFDVSGSQDKTIHLEIHNETNTIGFFNFPKFIDGQGLRTEIGLSPDIPLELVINVGVGKADLDLSGLTLKSVRINGGVGEIQIKLPAQEELYSVDIDGGVGEINITIQEGANLNLDIIGGIGEFKIDVPTDASLHLDAEIDIGSIRVPDFLDSISMTRNTVGEAGIWETFAYSESGVRIDINFRGDVGSLILK